MPSRNYTQLEKLLQKYVDLHVSEKNHLRDHPT
jgi:hypothetical protein